MASTMNTGQFFIERVPAMNREFESALMASYPAIYRFLKPRFSGGCLHRRRIAARDAD